MASSISDPSTWSALSLWQMVQLGLGLVAGIAVVAQRKLHGLSTGLAHSSAPPVSPFAPALTLNKPSIRPMRMRFALPSAPRETEPSRDRLNTEV